MEKFKNAVAYPAVLDNSESEAGVYTVTFSDLVMVMY